MSIKDFFESRFFEHNWKTKVFIFQVLTITIAFALGIAKVATKPDNIPMTRSDIMAITMSIKSYVFLTYEYTTQKVDRLKRFGSLKANAILNTMEIVFWSVVMGLAFDTVSRVCIGVNCAVGVFIGLVSMVIMAINFWAAVICWKDHSYFKHNGVRRGDSPQTKSNFNLSC